MNLAAIFDDQQRDDLAKYRVAIQRWMAILRRLEQLDKNADIELRHWQHDQSASRFEYMENLYAEAEPMLRVVQQVDEIALLAVGYPALTKLGQVFETVAVTHQITLSAKHRRQLT